MSIFPTKSQLCYTVVMKRLDSYSQHFLIKPKFVAKLISYSKLPKTKLVLDIGAGSGIISAQLAKAGFKQIKAIEPETKTFAKLSQNLANNPQITLINQDFLQFDLPNQNYNVFSNIPFHLSSKIVHKLVLADSSPDKIYLIVQKQFAEKLLIDQMDFVGQIGAAIAPWYKAKIRYVLRPSDFSPPPAVQTVLLELKKRPTPLLRTANKVDYFEFVKNCYHSPQFFAEFPDAKSWQKKPSQLKLAQWLELFQKANINH